jgi:hypothetical protein
MNRRFCFAVSTLALLLGTAALACEKHDPGKPAQSKPAQTELKAFGHLPHMTPRPSPDAEVPLWDNLGPLSFKITTKVPMAQRYFDQGLMLAFGFNHAEARRSFQAAQRLDPSCAMCHWGEALVLGPNINAPMDASLNEAALRAQARAASLAASASQREQALVRALGARYSADPARDRAALDRAYADAMVAVAKRFPRDTEIATLAAEALMDLSPWDYWQAEGREPKGRTGEIVALLEGVLKANPDHPGAIHFYIHAVEASDRPERAEAFADRLKAQDLGAGHLVHMPSHIYYRVGRFRDSLSVNRRAAAADEAFFEAVKPEGIYAGGYYPHNVHFLMVSAQMAGDGPTVIEAAEKLGRTVSDEAARAVPAFVQPIKAAPFFAHAQFSAPPVILALPKPGEGMPYVTAMWHYARGIAEVQRGDLGPRAGRPTRSRRFASRATCRRSPAPASRPRTCSLLRATWCWAGSRRRKPTGPARSRPSRPRRSSKAGSPTWSRPTGTTPCGSRSAPPISRPATSRPPRPRSAPA